MTEPTNEQNSQQDDFQKLAEEDSQGLVSEFMEFLRENKKWWLLPIVVVLLLFGLLFVVTPSVAPFIYTLF